MKKSLLLFISIIFFFGCEEDANNNYYNCVGNECVPFNGGQHTTLEDCLSVCNNNSIYTGDWNFKGNGYSYSGYYIYTPYAEWTYNESFTTNYNDSTGSVQLGENINELIIKYCGSCKPVVYNLNNEGLEWSDSFGGNVGWTLTDTTFFEIVIPSPPGYSPSFSTYNIEGWKL